MTRRFYLALLVALAASLTWPPASHAQAPTGATIHGIRCDRAEGAVFHIHQHLTILAHGKVLAVPDDVGRPIVGDCLYWIHTHTPDGIIHIESPVFRTFTLGDFFDVWGEPLGATAVASARVRRGELHVYVNGAPYRGDPRKIELAQHTDITLEAGPPYRKPSPFNDWQGQ